MNNLKRLQQIGLSIFIVGCLLSGSAFAEKDESKETNFRESYLQIFASDQPAPQDFEAYELARKRAIEWVAHYPESAINWLNTDSGISNGLVGLLMLEVFARMSFDSAEWIIDFNTQLPEESVATYLSRVLQLRSELMLVEGDSDLIPIYLADDHLPYLYVKLAPKLDFLRLIAFLEEATCAPNTKKNVYGLILERWLKTAPDALSEYVQSLPLDKLRGQESFIRKWVVEQPEVALGFLALLHTNENKKAWESDVELLTQALEVWLAKDEFAALAWVDSLKATELSGVVVESLVEASLKADGRLALSYFPEIGDEVTRIAVAPRLATLLADRDPVAGVEWIRGFADLLDMRPSVEKFYSHLAKYDLAYAVEIYPEDLPVGLQQESVRVIMGNAHQIDAGEAFDWMETLSPEATKDYVLTRWFQEIVTVNPERAAEFVRKHPDSSKHHRPNHNIGVSWAIQDPEAAMTWAEGLTLPSAQGGAGYGVAAGLLKLSDEQALDWIYSLPQGNTRNWAVGALYDNRWEQRPDVVFKLALSVTDVRKNLRRKYLKDSIQAMRDQGTLDAVAILQRNDLPAEDREWLESVLKED